jgi:hypothetical protein
VRKVNCEGSVALITVLIITATLLSTGVALVLISLDLSMATKDALSRQRVEAMKQTCVEESLSRLKASAGYSGTLTYSYNGDTCSSTVTTDLNDPNVRVLAVTGTTDGYSLDETVRVDISTEPFHVLH